MSFILSPESPFVMSPISKIVTNPYSTTVYTANYLTTAPSYLYEIDTGLNDNPLAQYQTIEHFWYKILDKWLYEDDMCHLLKYLRINKDGNVEYISSETDLKDNKICNDSLKDVEKKTDFIQENLFSKSTMKKLLIKITQELDLKWFQLYKYENIIVKTSEHYLKKLLKERVGTK